MKKVTALLLALAFIPTFSLRGGIWHNTFNFSYLFAAVAFCTMLLFILRYLFINRSSKVKIALVTNADQPLLSGVELSILLWVIFTTALMGLSYFYSPAPAAQWVIKILSYATMHFLLLYFYFLALQEQTVMKMAYLVCLAAIPLLSYQQLYSYYTTGSLLTLTSVYRAQGLMGDPNEFAKNVVVVILALFYIIFFEDIALRTKILCFAGIALMLLMLVWSGSRGGFVMLATGAALFWLLLFRHIERRKKNYFYIPLALALGILGLYLSKYDYFTRRFIGLIGGNIGRVNMASEGLQLLFRGKAFNFLFGYGIEAWPSFVHLSIFPHNFIIEYLFEFGYIPGLALLGTLAAALVYPLWDTRRRYYEKMVTLREYSSLKMLFIISVCAAIPSLFNHILPTNFTFIFFTGLYLSLYRSLEDQGAAERGEGGKRNCAEALPQ